MGKKIQSEMDAQREQFVDGAVARGVEPARAELIFDQMEKFAGYGFNKSHAAAYALVAYQTAYLKANYPVEFLAASMTLDLGNTDKLNHVPPGIGPARHPAAAARHQPLAADLLGRDGPQERQAGDPLCAGRGQGCRRAGDAACWSASASANGRFKDLFDLAQRLDAKTFNRGQFESLAKAGAFDRAQSEPRADLRRGRIAAAPGEPGRRASGRTARAACSALGLSRPPGIAAGRRTGRRSRSCSTNSTAIGFYLSSHPLDAYGKSLERAGILRWADLPAALAANGATRFRLAGIVVGRKERTSARGNRFAFVQMSDTSGVFEVTLFAEMLSQARALFDAGQPLAVTVDVRSEEDSLRLTAQKIEPLDDVVAHAAAGLRVFLGEARALAHSEEPDRRARRGGRGRVSVVLDLAEQRGRDRDPRRLPRRPADARRGQVAARHRRRPRHLSVRPGAHPLLQCRAKAARPGQGRDGALHGRSRTRLRERLDRSFQYIRTSTRSLRAQAKQSRIDEPGAHPVGIAASPSVPRNGIQLISRKRSQIAGLRGRLIGDADAGERAGDAFERLALGLDADREFDECRGDHQSGAEQIAGEDRAALAGADQYAEEPRRDGTADRGAERVEKGDGEGAGLQRKAFADRQIGGARRRRGEKEDAGPAQRSAARRSSRPSRNSQPTIASSTPESA